MAGVICISIGGICVLLAIVSFCNSFGKSFTMGSGPPSEYYLITEYYIGSLISAIGAVLVLKGGFYALSRKKWVWALTGSIATFCVPVYTIYIVIQEGFEQYLYLAFLYGLAAIAFCLSIVAVSFTIISRSEFVNSDD